MKFIKLSCRSFASARTLARSLNRGIENKELEKCIINQSIKELEYILIN